MAWSPDMTDLAPTPRSKVRRQPARASYDRTAIDAILDEGLVCHVGFDVDGQPFVIPTIYARAGDSILLHGSAASRMLRHLREGVDVCVTVTLIDGLVFARSAFHHSMNYRSVVVFGRARAIEETSAKIDALRAIVEHAFPGRYDHVRPPDRKELRQTAVLALPIEEASAKVRSGPPVDDEEDYALDVWAGVLPLALLPRAPVPDARLSPGVEVPELVSRYRREGPDLSA
jgi:nitroimidazol reductase NimA-like FMN-containing flavoprotein (pyridoxamine 5'-phosphate oxidase superfamily)